MSFGWTVAGTVGAVLGLNFSFMMWAFTSGAVANRRDLDKVPLSPALRRYLYASLPLLMGSWVAAAGLVWWAYFRHPSSLQQAWWALPVPLHVAHFIVCGRALESR